MQPRAWESYRSLSASWRSTYCRSPDTNFYAPKGVGALFVKRGVALEPALHGAGHEGGVRPGTENVPYIVGLGRAMTLASQELDSRQERVCYLRDQLEQQLGDVLGDRMSVNGGSAERLPNTSSVNFPSVSGIELFKTHSRTLRLDRRCLP